MLYECGLDKLYWKSLSIFFPIVLLLLLVMCAFTSSLIGIANYSADHYMISRYISDNSARANVGALHFVMLLKTPS